MKYIVLMIAIVPLALAQCMDDIDYLNIDYTYDMCLGHFGSAGIACGGQSNIDMFEHSSSMWFRKFVYSESTNSLSDEWDGVIGRGPLSFAFTGYDVNIAMAITPIPNTDRYVATGVVKQDVSSSAYKLPIVIIDDSENDVVDSFNTGMFGEFAGYDIAIGNSSNYIIAGERQPFTIAYTGSACVASLNTDYTYDWMWTSYSTSCDNTVDEWANCCLQLPNGNIVAAGGNSLLGKTIYYLDEDGNHLQSIYGRGVREGEEIRDLLLSRVIPDGFEVLALVSYPAISHGVDECQIKKYVFKNNGSFYPVSSEYVTPDDNSHFIRGHSFGKIGSHPVVFANALWTYNTNPSLQSGPVILAHTSTGTEQYPPTEYGGQPWRIEGVNSVRTIDPVCGILITNGLNIDCMLATTINNNGDESDCLVCYYPSVGTIGAQPIVRSGTTTESITVNYDGNTLESISCNLPSDPSQLCRVYDLTGRIAAEINPEVDNSGRSLFRIESNCSDLPNGVYCYAVESAGEVIVGDSFLLLR